MTGLNADISDDLLVFKLDGSFIFHPVSGGFVFVFFGGCDGCFVKPFITAGFEDADFYGFAFGRNQDGQFDGFDGLCGIIGCGGVFCRIDGLRGCG